MHKDLPRSILQRGLLEPSEDKGLPPNFHRENRQKFLKQLFSDNPQLESENSVVLFKGAPTQFFFEHDNNFYPHQESSFLSLFGTFEGDIHAFIELKTGKTVIVPPRLDPAYKIWMVVPDPEYFRSRYEIDDSIFEDELQAYLEKLEVTCIYLPYGKNEAYPKPVDVASFDWLSKFKVDKSTVYPSLIQTRMYKSENEVKVLKTAYDYTIEAHKNIMQAVRPGVYENQIEAIFRFEGHSRLGSKWLTAHPVVSSGTNLYKFDYYDNDRQIPDGSLVLADLGIKYNGYCADVTSTFPVNGKFSPLQRDIYDLVVEGVLAAKAALKNDSDVEGVHRKVLDCVMQGLVKRGIITNYEPAVDFLLIPHLTIIPSGHAETETGHDSRTAEKLKKSNPKATELTYMWPKLKTSSVVTVSVGAYFDVNHLKTRVLAGNIDEKKFAQYAKEVGGVRIERQFVITETGAQELGSSPLTADEIESCMKGSL